MFVRVKDGYYAGQVREFPSHIAQDLLAKGRAENPFAEPSPVEIVRVAAEKPVPARQGRKVR
jgi:hypothetical protein